MKNVSCGILAGGKSSRMGQDKATLKVGNTTLLNYMILKLKNNFEEIIVSSKEDLELTKQDVKIVKDIQALSLPLIGISSALKNCSNERCFIIACDMPYLNALLIEYLQTFKSDVVCPKAQGELQVLHAVYSQSCIPFIERSIDKKLFNVSSFFASVKVKIVEIDDQAWSVYGKSPFTNLNTKDDFERFTMDFPFLAPHPQ